MKKLLLIAITGLMVVGLAGCASKEKEEHKIGGFVDVENGEITDDLKEMFDKACEGYTGMSFEPIELLQTQVVKGTNYKFLCNGTVVVPNGETKKVIVTVYKDLDGNCSIDNVEDYTE